MSSVNVFLFVNKYKTKQNETILAVQDKFMFSVCLLNVISSYIIMLEYHHTTTVILATYVSVTKVI